MPIEFINADLEITSNEDLEPIKVAFDQHGNRFFELYCGETNPGCYLATFEIHPEEECSDDGNKYRELNAQEKIQAFCDSISELKGEARDVWFRAERRLIDLGYLSDDRCEAFNDRLSVEALRRMASLGIELALTIYPHKIESQNTSFEATGDNIAS